MPVTESKNGRFQFKPGSAMRRNLPKRVITATSAVRTVKKLAMMRYNTTRAANTIGIHNSSAISVSSATGWYERLDYSAAVEISYTFIERVDGSRRVAP